METEQNEIQTTNFQDPSELQKYKMKYDALLIESDEEFNNPKSEDFYVLSKTFLREWNEYVGYESGHPDLKKKPTYFNSDLIESLEETKKYVKMSTQIILKKGFQNKIDYEVINKNLMDFFEKDFAGIRIQRKAYTQQDGHKFVEVYLKDLNAVFISHSCLVEIDRNQRHELLVQKLQVSSQSTIQEFKEVLLKINGKNNFGLENLRLWKISQEIDKFFKETKQTCNNTKSFDYEIPIKGIFLEKNLEVKIEDFGFTEADILIIEIRENTENWNFVQNDVPTMKKCGFCSKYAETVLICGCKKVGYCTKECKFKDKRYHKRYCDNASESDDEEEEFQKGEKSRYGLTGLHNLGNTCFMNSALQCLSNTFNLTKYFLEKRYIPEINVENILGSKGKLAKEYANLLNNLWFNSNDTFSPYLIKSRVSDIHQMFCGYNQHDSQEFLQFLLDGLHEDLNRIKIKPYVADIEFKTGTPDHVMAKESWKNYCKRNLSIITDLLMGQYKSVITCPTCSKISTTFDPFLTWSVPISSKKKKFISFKYLPHELGKIPHLIKLEFTSDICDIPQFKKIAGDYVGVNPDSFSLYYISRSIEKISEEKTVKEIRKKVKNSSYYELFLIEKSVEEQAISKEELVEIHVNFSHEEETSWSSSYKRNFFVRPFYFSQKDTAQTIHLKIFKYLRYYFENSNNQIELEEESPIKSLSDEEAYKVINNQNSCYTLSWSPNYRGFEPCEFCGKKYCQGCQIADTKEIVLQDVVRKCKTSSSSSINNIELEVFWKPKKPFATSLAKFMNNYQPLNKKSGLELEDHKDEMEEDGLNLYDCLKLFGEPEQLDTENKWYCADCKEHKLAKKQMSVYKAPKYLIIHLKRFKSKGSRSFYSYGNHGKANDLVRFPIKGLKLTDYVINHEKIEDYFKENSETMKNENLIYDLYAISNHSGGLGGGHYYAYAKNALKNSWFCFNDSSVREISENEVVTSAAYCLFYERRDEKAEKNVEFNVLKIMKQEKNKQRNDKREEKKEKDVIGSATRNDELAAYRDDLHENSAS